MYIEDIIGNLVGFNSITFMGTMNFIPGYDLNLLQSFDNQLSKGMGFTEKQSNIAVRILTRYQDKISVYLTKDVKPFLETPQYKLPRRILSPEKSVKIEVCPDRNTKVFKVKFPYNEALVESIKKHKEEIKKTRIKQNGFQNYPIVDWNSETKTWDFEIYEENLIWIYSNLGTQGFEFDQEIISLKNDVETIQNNLENYVPMVVFDENRFKFINTHSSVPQPESTDLLEVLFDAKKYGIFTWDETIGLAIDDNSINPVTKTILQDNKGQGIVLDSGAHPIDCLSDLVTYSKKIVVVIPGGTELENLKVCHEFFKRCGISNEAMSVLFRLDSSAGKICNEFVKEQKLNNPINNDVKIFFVSAKVPKPLIGSNFEIDAILNLGNNSAHYTVKNLVRNHHCVVNYAIDRIRKGNHFANL